MDPPSDARDNSPNLTFTPSPPPIDPYPILRILILRLNHYFIPIIILLGIIGNLFSLIVFLGTYMRRRSFSVYLAALAISDTGFLVSLTVTWLEYIQVNVFHTNGWCQLVIYVSYSSSFLSVWFIVGFTVERYIAVCHPLKRPDMCTVDRAWYVVTSLSTTAFVVYSVTIWTSGITQVTGVKGDKYYICTPLNKFMTVHTTLTYADTIVTLLVPFLTIVILNIMITLRITYFQKQHRKCRQQEEFPLTSPALQSSSSDSSVLPQGIGTTQGRPSLCSKAQIQVTKMLLITSSLFLLINLPSYVLRVRLFVLSALHHQLDMRAQHFQVLLQQIFQLVYYFNFGSNFVVYSMCSGKFRQAFLRFWRQMLRRLPCAGIPCLGSTHCCCYHCSCFHRKRLRHTMPGTRYRDKRNMYFF